MMTLETAQGILITVGVFGCCLLVIWAMFSSDTNRVADLFLKAFVAAVAFGVVVATAWAGVVVIQNAIGILP